jgi:hypothetical protein
MQAQGLCSYGLLEDAKLILLEDAKLILLEDAKLILLEDAKLILLEDAKLILSNLKSHLGCVKFVHDGARST